MMELHEIQYEIEKLLGQVDKITKQYHEAKTEFENLDKYSKPLLAEMATGREGSEAQRNREALASKAYSAHTLAVEKARRDYNRAWALLEGLRIKMELLRSLNKNYNG